MAQSFNVLFLCTGNSARSILAESLLNEIGKGRFHAFSAGSQPTGSVNPFALKLLTHLGIDVSGLRSKSWDEFARGEPNLDFVFTVCDSAGAETCPVWPGQPMTAHWGLPDPAAVTGSDAEIAAAFTETCRCLRQRIEAFASLPLETLDRLSLKTRLDAIGQAGSEQGPTHDG